MKELRAKFESEFEKNPAISASTITVAIVIVLVFAKSIALAYSGSAAVLSALIDSLEDIALSLMTLFAVRLSHKPADEDHRSGHGKVEGLTALLQGGALIGGASFLVLESVGRLISPVPITNHLFTMFLMGISVMLCVVISIVQKLAVKKTGSLAIEADSAHYSSDIAINGAVFVVVTADYFGFGGRWLDPLCAMGVAALMVLTAKTIAGKSVSMLMDRELPDNIRSKLIAMIRSHPEVLGLHDLRATQSGSKYMIFFDIELDPSMLLWSAHEISRSIETTILQEFPNAEIMIHIDPYGDPDDSRHHKTEGSKEGQAA